jgi:hypothetical protein
LVGALEGIRTPGRRGTGNHRSIQLSYERIVEITLNGADDETRTRDPNLGKVVLYQLSYVRVSMSYPVGEIKYTIG